MAKIHIDFLVAETFHRLFGVTSLLELLDQRIPEIERREREALNQTAKAQEWGDEDYYVEQDILNDKFRNWIPRFAAYCVIILLQSVVENQIFACAERVGEMRGSPFRVKDIKGHGIEQAAIYLQRLIALDVKQDLAWKDLQNLQDLRNAIVHRGGKCGTSPDHQKIMKHLVTAYSGNLLFPTHLYGEVWPSMNLCRHFAAQVQKFFERLFKAVGLPGEEGKFDS